jgi:hypothetical protein
VLLNSEVKQVLEDRGAFSTDRFSSATPIEKQAGEFLSSVCGTKPYARDKYVALKEALGKFGLASSEVFQLMNWKSRAPVEVFLMVDDMEERFGMEAETIADEILALIEAHFPAK